MRQPYRELKVKAKQFYQTVTELLQEREEQNELNPSGAYPVLIEEVLNALDITSQYWDKYRDFNDTLHSPEAFKNIYPTSADKDYKIYASYYKQRIELRDELKKTEQKLGAGVVRAAFLNPKIQSLCIFLTKQKYYGGYMDRPETASPSDVKISVKLGDGNVDVGEVLYDGLLGFMLGGFGGAPQIFTGSYRAKNEAIQMTKLQKVLVKPLQKIQLIRRSLRRHRRWSKKSTRAAR